MTSGDQTHPMRVSGFRALLATYALNEIGEQFAIVALAVLVYDRTTSPLAVTVVFLTGKFLPALLATASTARLAHLRAGRSLPPLYAAQLACYLALAGFAARAPELGFLVPVLLVQGVIAVTARGLSRGVVAMTLDDPELLRRGNALINIVFAVGSVAGPTAAVLILAVWSPAGALLLGGACFAAAGLVIAVFGRGLATAEHHDPEQSAGTHSTLEGFRYVWELPEARRIIGGQAVAWTAATIIIPIEVVYAEEALHSGSTGFGWLLAAWGAGIVLGSGLFARARLSLSTIVAGATGLMAVAYFGLAAAPSLAVALAASVLGGLGNGMQWVAVLTALQQSVQREFYARASGLLESVMSGVPGIAYTLGGVIAALAGPRVAYTVAGIGVAAIALYWSIRPIVASAVSDPSGGVHMPPADMTLSPSEHS